MKVHVVDCNHNHKPRLRLAKYIAGCSHVSRRKAEEMISQGRVMVNGVRIESPAMCIDSELDVVVFDGCRLVPVSRVYLLVYKPRGVICSNCDAHADRIISDLLPGEFGRLFSIGRLDRDSEGLIICTNDGDLAQAVAHPRHQVLKTYYVDIDKMPSPKALLALTRGIEDDGEMLSALAVRLLDEIACVPGGTRLEFVLNQGRKREIRRLCKAMGWRVLRLERIAIGDIRDPSLAPGSWRHLSAAEVASLRSR